MESIHVVKPQTLKYKYVDEETEIFFDFSNVPNDIDTSKICPFTGIISDRVELYLGDIIEHNVFGTGYIYYSSSAAAYRVNFATSRTWPIPNPDRIKVIGNRHSHPKMFELLFGEEDV